MRNEIALFDSGVGGLKILEGLRKTMPNENFVYAFDRTFAPYGTKSERAIIKRAHYITSVLIKRKVKAIVIACNTATAVAIDSLRHRYDMDFIGVEPPVAPALKVSGNGKILLLCTNLTAKSKRLARLCSVRDDIIVSPQKNLATIIEDNFLNLYAVKDEVENILAPYKGEKIKAVALGCTHYYCIKDKIEKFFGGNIPVFTATDGVCNRVKSLVRHSVSPNGGFVKYLYL